MCQPGLAMERGRFKRWARRHWEDIPEHFREGATLLIHDEAEPDPEYDDVFLMGACEPAFAALEAALDASGDPRPAEASSMIHVWYGSFVAMAERARTFDWQYEIAETLLHELEHHWERRVGLYGLDLFDAAQIQNFRRVRGREVPEGYWRHGEPAGDHRWRIDGDLFVELDGDPPWTLDPDDGGGPLRVEPDDGAAWATIPQRGGTHDGERGDLIVAQRPPPGLWTRLTRWFQRNKEPE